MGKRGPEFEVERRREDKALVKDEEHAPKGSEDGGSDTQEDEEDSWRSWAENPRAVESMKYFVYVQSFVMFLTFGLPQLQKCWDLLHDLLFS